jgi:hypothetical protein
VVTRWYAVSCPLKAARALSFRRMLIACSVILIWSGALAGLWLLITWLIKQQASEMQDILYTLKVDNPIVLFLMFMVRKH